MKKIYMAPAATIYSIKPSSVIATSVRVCDTTLSSDDISSNYEID